DDKGHDSNTNNQVSKNLRQLVQVLLQWGVCFVCVGKHISNFTNFGVMTCIDNNPNTTTISHVRVLVSHVDTLSNTTIISHINRQTLSNWNRFPCQGSFFNL